MHKPDKKGRKWLSEPLLHFSEPADRGGGNKRKKKKSIFTPGTEWAGCLLSQGLHSALYNASLFCEIRADVSECQNIAVEMCSAALAPRYCRNTSFVMLADRICEVLELVIEVDY